MHNRKPQDLKSYTHVAFAVGLLMFKLKSLTRSYSSKKKLLNKINTFFNFELKSE